MCCQSRHRSYRVRWSGEVQTRRAAAARASSPTPPGRAPLAPSAPPPPQPPPAPRPPVVYGRPRTGAYPSSRVSAAPSTGERSSTRLWGGRLLQSSPRKVRPLVRGSFPRDWGGSWGSIRRGGCTTPEGSTVPAGCCYGIAGSLLRSPPNENSPDRVFSCAINALGSSKALRAWRNPEGDLVTLRLTRPEERRCESHSWEERGDAFHSGLRSIGAVTPGWPSFNRTQREKAQTGTAAPRPTNWPPPTTGPESGSCAIRKQAMDHALSRVSWRGVGPVGSVWPMWLSGRCRFAVSVGVRCVG